MRSASPLPRLLLITNRHVMRPSFEAALEGALRAGARLVQLREKDLPEPAFLALAKRAQALCSAYRARLVVNAAPSLALNAGADGVHVPESSWPCDDQVRDGLLLGASVHSQQTAEARSGLANYLLFGPVFATPSHPHSCGQGLERLSQVVAVFDGPVFAVGGVNPSNAAACREAGAHGVAVISAAWQSPDIAAIVRALS